MTPSGNPFLKLASHGENAFSVRFSRFELSTYREELKTAIDINKSSGSLRGLLFSMTALSGMVGSCD